LLRIFERSAEGFVAAIMTSAQVPGASETSKDLGVVLSTCLC
jgi:hypothetical protein